MKQRILSGITSTGRLTLGNYLGAISNFLKLQEEGELFIFIANLHALTTPINPVTLKQNTLDIAAWYFACGIDGKKSNVFIQSEVLEHSQLSYILLCHSYLGELERMTQFKDKSQKSNQQNKTTSIPSGLLVYPSLMAADILLYDADKIPVGSDQTQHLELTKDLAMRMNNKYKSLNNNHNLFKIPEQYQHQYAHKIMSLQEPTKKMSKSDLNDKNTIYLSDDAATITNKIKKAVTDSEDNIKYNPETKPGVSNLLTIYAAVTNQSISACEKYFAKQNYGFLKNEVAKAVVALLTPIQIRHQEFINNQKLLFELLKHGADKARAIAQAKLELVQNIIGINCGTLKEK